MARLIGPDEASRKVETIDSSGRFTAKRSRPATVYADAGATQLADILTTGGAPIADSVVTTDAYSMLPLFQFPDGVDTLWVVVDGGPAWPMYARADDRLDAVKATADAAETPAGAQAKVAAHVAATDPHGDRAYADTARGGPGRLVSTLRRGQQDAVLVILGDSTGNETGEWAYRLAAWLGQQYPAYTVTHALWNDDGSQSYGAATTIQTGTGPRTLTVYNGSVSGASYNYPFTTSTRFGLMIPVEPTTVVISYGYNSLTGAYRQQQQELSDWVIGYWPHCEYVLTSQPPKATASADAAAHLLRQADTRAIAAERGWGLIDVTQRFIDYGSYDTLINADTIHPLQAGQDIWVDEVQGYFSSKGRATIAANGTRGISRIFMDPTRFIAFSGTPALTFVAGIIIPKWDFDPTTEERVIGSVDVPPEWGLVHVDLLWSTPGGSTLGVVWQVDYVEITDAMVPQSGKTFAAATSGTPVTVASVSTVNVVRSTRVFTATRFSGGRPLAFRVRRLAVDAADTFAGDAWFLGLVIRRAE